MLFRSGCVNSTGVQENYEEMGEGKGQNQGQREQVNNGTVREKEEVVSKQEIEVEPVSNKNAEPEVLKDNTNTKNKPKTTNPELRKDLTQQVIKDLKSSVYDDIVKDAVSQIENNK